MIPLFKVYTDPSVPDRVRETLLSGQLAQGPQVEAFEDALASRLGLGLLGRPVTVNSGTAAIHLALRLTGIGPGDVVLSTPMTCLATNSPAIALGANILWVDIDPATGCVSEDSLRHALGHYDLRGRAKACVVVDWAGYPAVTSDIKALCDAHNIDLIEDSAQAFGAIWDGYHCSSADFQCFSFQAIKTLTTGDGGALICADAADRERARLLRWFGLDRSTRGRDGQIGASPREHGYKFHMNDLAATIGIGNLRAVDFLLDRHRRNAHFFDIRLHGSKRLTPVGLHPGSTRWVYTVLAESAEHKARCMELLREREIDAREVHERNDRYPMFDGRVLNPSDRLPGVEVFSERQFSVPCGWWLTDDERERVWRTLGELS